MTTIYVVDAFTTKPNTGNRAGVVLDADHLSTQEMQDIAAFAGYSETAFVLSPKIKAMTYMFDILRQHMKSQSVDMRRSLLIFTCNYWPPIRLSINRKTGLVIYPFQYLEVQKRYW